MLAHFILYSFTLMLGCLWTLKKPGFLGYTISMVVMALIVFLSPVLIESAEISDLRKLVMTGAGFFLLFTCFAYSKMVEASQISEATEANETKDA